MHLTGWLLLLLLLLVLVAGVLSLLTGLRLKELCLQIR
jgi:hypothetical protein